MSVTVNGEPFGGTNVLIEDGNIVLVMPVGMSFMIRWSCSGDEGSELICRLQK